MVATIRTKAALATLFHDNFNGEISAQDARDFIDSIFANQLGYYVVAASDASQFEKDRANAICDGVADNVEIQAAFDSLRPVWLTGGSFHASSSVIISNPAQILKSSNKAFYYYSGANEAFRLSGFYPELHFPKIIIDNASTAQVAIRYFALHFHNIIVPACGFAGNSNAHSACIYYDVTLEIGSNSITGGGHWYLGAMNYVASPTGIGALGCANVLTAIWLGPSDANGNNVQDDHFDFDILFGGTSSVIKLSDASHVHGVDWCIFRGELDGQGFSDYLLDISSSYNTFELTSYGTASLGDAAFGVGSVGNRVRWSANGTAPPVVVDAGENDWGAYLKAVTVNLPIIAAIGTGDGQWQNDAHGSLGARMHLHCGTATDLTLYTQEAPVPSNIFLQSLIAATLTLHLAVTTGGNNFYMNRFILSLGRDGDATETQNLAVGGVVAAPAAANTTKLYQFSLTSALLTTEVIQAFFQFLRNSQAGDDNTGTMLILGCWVDYWARGSQ